MNLFVRYEVQEVGYHDVLDNLDKSGKHSSALVAATPSSTSLLEECSSSHRSCAVCAKLGGTEDFIASGS
jgi:hypothetical protein